MPVGSSARYSQVIMERFYWLIDGRLAGCSRPGGPRAERQSLTSDLRQLAEEGVGAVLSLTENPLEAQGLAESGLTVLHLPVPDMQAPSPGEILQALDFIDRQH